MIPCLSAICRLLKKIAREMANTGGVPFQVYVWAPKEKISLMTSRHHSVPSQRAWHDQHSRLFSTAHMRIDWSIPYPLNSSVVLSDENWTTLCNLKHDAENFSCILLTSWNTNNFNFRIEPLSEGCSIKSVLVENLSSNKNPFYRTPLLVAVLKENLR